MSVFKLKASIKQPIPNPQITHNASRFTNHEIKNTHINLGTGKDISIKELALLIKEITEYKGDIQWDATKPDGTMRKLMDVTKINDLGWKERIDLENGIKMIYHMYEKGVSQ